MGVPSLQRASGLSRYVIVSVPSSLSTAPPLSTVGASIRTGEAPMLWLTSNSMRRGTICTSTDQLSHVALLQEVIGLRHSGHCSTANTISPPGRSAAGSPVSGAVSAEPVVVAAGSVAPSLPAVSPSVDPPHAAAAISAATTSRPRKYPAQRHGFARRVLTEFQTSRHRGYEPGGSKS